MPPIPTPPTTCNAPLLVALAAVVFVIDTALLEVAPRLVIVCNVLSFQTVTVPVDELTLVSVPAVNVCTPMLVTITLPVLALTNIPVPAVMLVTPLDPSVEVVITSLPLTFKVPPTHKFFPKAAPPVTISAPLVVFIEFVALVIITALVVEFPRLVTVCSVLSFQTVTTPVDVLTLVSVPAIIAETKLVFELVLVTTC